MARSAAGIVPVVALFAMLFVGASAQSGCTTALVGLVPCLSYITGNASTPLSSCCSQLASVVQSQPLCLCLVLNGAVGSALGTAINTTQALALPGACNVKTPPISRCNATAGGPAASPAESPASPATSTTPSSPSSPSPSSPTTPSTPSNPSSPSSPSTPSVASAPSGGSKTTPSAGSQSSDGNSKKTTQSLTVALLLVAACASALTSF